MRPLILIRLAHALQNRRAITLSEAMLRLATEKDIAYAMRRLLK